MRKYIITFNYKEIEFSAKVVVKKVFGKSIIATTLLNCELDFLLSKSTFIFFEKGETYELLLVKKDGICEILKWSLSLEYNDKFPLTPSGGFSLS